MRALWMGLAICFAAPYAWAGFDAGAKPAQGSQTNTSSHKAKPAPQPVAPVNHGPNMGVGFTLGWEATYGNSVSFHWLPERYLDLSGGLGYNQSGMKLGAGGTFLYHLTRSFGFRSGLALVYSGGSSGEVALEANFTPDGTGDRQEISASKTYEVSSAFMANMALGGFWAISQGFHLILEGTYNAVLSGNEVTLSDKIQYSSNIEASNQYEFEREFDQKARDKAEAGGLGFNLGIMFLW